MPSIDATIKVSCFPEKWHVGESRIHIHTEEQQHLDLVDSFKALNTSGIRLQLKGSTRIDASALPKSSHRLTYQEIHTGLRWRQGLMSWHSAQEYLRLEATKQVWEWLKFYTPTGLCNPSDICQQGVCLINTWYDLLMAKWLHFLSMSLFFLLSQETINIFRERCLIELKIQKLMSPWHH